MIPGELRGWLLDVYPDPGRGVVVWLVGEDGGRYRLTQLAATCCLPTVY